MLRRSLLIIFILSITISLVLAVDDQGNPNDPTVNERANACYDDGSMAGKCEIDWDWVCGWYLIRFEYNLIDRANFLPSCLSVLPPEIIPEQAINPATPPPPTGCIAVSSNRYFYFGNSDFIGVAFTSYSDAYCSVPSFIESWNPAVNAADLGSAAAICANHGYNDGAIVYGFIYACHVPIP